MKTIFITAALLLSVPQVACAQQFWEPAALLSDMFPGSDTVTPLTLTLDEDAKVDGKMRLGMKLKDSYTVYRAYTGDHLDGYVVIDEQIGQHEPITFAVQIDPAGTVIRQEVLVYREKYGSEVRDARFRKQFVGKTATDPLKVGSDVRIISGATYSSKAMAVGVKRALWLVGRVRMNRL